MKKFIIAAVIASVLTGCSKKDGVKFCEGVDTEGNGVNCGKVFTTGDLTAVINNKTPFEADTITVKIIRTDGDRKKPEKSLSLSVGREKKIANATLQFYNSGKYLVEAYRSDDKIAEGSIEVRDTY